MGGVADGVAEKRVMGALPNLGKMIGFDPFPELFENKPDNPLKEDPEFVFIPKGLSEKNGEKFFHLNGHGSFVTEKRLSETDRKTQVTTLDDFNLERLDLLKLDVERSEMEALQGAGETIRRCRPALAVCVYHERTDIFEIPLYLADTLDGYQSRFGHYSNGFLDSVCYAVPEG